MRRTLALLLLLSLLGVGGTTSVAATPAPVVPEPRLVRSAVAIGSPWEDAGGRANAGVVHVIPRTTGANAALSFGSTIMITEAQLTGSSWTDSAFGYAVALGDLNGDGYDDLAIGAPGRENAAGRVYVIPNGPGGVLDLARTRTLRQGIGGVTGTKEADDGFGT